MNSRYQSQPGDTKLIYQTHHGHRFVPVLVIHVSSSLQCVSEESQLIDHEKTIFAPTRLTGNAKCRYAYVIEYTHDAETCQKQQIKNTLSPLQTKG